MKLQIAVIVAMLSSGCAVNEKYPDDWAGLEQPTESRADGCPDIAGRYIDKSVLDETPNFDPSMKSLTAALYSTAETDRNLTGTTNTLEINQPSDGVISIKPSDGEAFQISIDEGHFSCKDGVINLGSHGEFMGCGMGIGGGTSGYSLYDSEDQSLVLQERAFIAGVFTIIPFALRTKDWVARWVLQEDYTPRDYPRKGNDLTDEEKKSYIMGVIDQRNEEILYVNQAALGRAANEVNYTCYGDGLVLTNNRIFAVWKIFQVHPDCPISTYRGNYTSWEYTDVISIKPEPYSKAVKLEFRNNLTSEDKANESSSNSLVILSMEGIEMMRVETIIRERINPVN